jgi:hypothetical protein
VLLYKSRCPALLPFPLHLLSLPLASPLGLAGPILPLTSSGFWGGGILYDRNGLLWMLFQDRGRHLNGMSPYGQKGTHALVHNERPPDGGKGNK